MIFITCYDSISQLRSLDLCVFAADNNVSFCPYPEDKSSATQWRRIAAPRERGRRAGERHAARRARVWQVACLHQGQEQYNHSKSAHVVLVYCNLVSSAELQ